MSLALALSDINVLQIKFWLNNYTELGKNNASSRQPRINNRDICTTASPEQSFRKRQPRPQRSSLHRKLRSRPYGAHLCYRGAAFSLWWHGMLNEASGHLAMAAC